MFKIGSRGLGFGSRLAPPRPTVLFARFDCDAQILSIQDTRSKYRRRRATTRELSLDRGPLAISYLSSLELERFDR
jgi:hypothetical protein